MFLKKVFSVLLIALLSTSFLLAQSDSLSVGQKVKMLTKDGQAFIGNIQSVNDSSVTLKTEKNMVLTIPKANIEKYLIIPTGSASSAYLYSDPNDTRLFFSPTGRTLKKGHGYFSDYYIFFPTVAYGALDFITLSAGISIFPGATDQLVYLAPKIRFLKWEKLDVAGGILYANTLRGEGSGGGITFAIATYGTSDYGATFGLGWGFAGKDFTNKPVIMIGGEMRLSRSIKLISENWIPPESDTKILSAGIRFFGRHLAADLGLFYPTGTNMKGFPFIPWVGFAYNFGK